MSTCQGTTSSGKPCSLPGGWGTDESETYCKYHLDQANTVGFKLPQFDSVEAADGSDIIRVGDTVYVITPDGYTPVPNTSDGSGDSGGDTGFGRAFGRDFGG